MDSEKIKFSLKKCGLKKSDTIVLHADAGVAAQIITSEKNKLNYLINLLLKYVGNRGNIIVPTFTYSACKNNSFEKNDQSEVGLFSETFRKLKKVKRTDHPIFSFAIFGKKFGYFNKADIKTCFGKNSIFGLFHKLNVKIVCLGCDIDRITFTHYVEEFYKVYYRYNKIFNIYLKNKKKTISTNYYVRKSNIKNNIDLKRLNKYLVKKKRIKISNFGRYNLIAINSKDFFLSCVGLLKKNKKSLIKN